jgi:hypothetical protein
LLLHGLVPQSVGGQLWSVGSETDWLHVASREPVSVAVEPAS